MASRKPSVIGPDATDVAISMSAIQSLHGVGLTLVMSPDGTYGEGGLKLTAVAVRNNPISGEVARSVSRSRYYPSNDSASLEGALLRLVYEIDLDCSQFWVQGDLTA